MSPGSKPAHGQRHSLERKVMLPAARDRAAEAKGRLESQWDIVGPAEASEDTAKGKEERFVSIFANISIL